MLILKSVKNHCEILYTKKTRVKIEGKCLLSTVTYTANDLPLTPLNKQGAVKNHGKPFF